MHFKYILPLLIVSFAFADSQSLIGKWSLKKRVLSSSNHSSHEVKVFTSTNTILTATSNTITFARPFVNVSQPHKKLILFNRTSKYSPNKHSFVYHRGQNKIKYFYDISGSNLILYCTEDIRGSVYQIIEYYEKLP